MKERDKFLVEYMGDCWHEPPNPNFSTWQGFGLLWEWVIKQEWYWHFDCHLMYVPSDHEFTKNDSDGYLHKDYINPDKFADAVYGYLKNKN